MRVKDVHVSDFLLPTYLDLEIFRATCEKEAGWRPIGRLKYEPAEAIGDEVFPPTIRIQVLLPREAFQYAWDLNGSMQRQHILFANVKSPALTLEHDGGTTRWNLENGDVMPISDFQLKSVSGQSRS
jgi:hypothetical protein